MLGWCYINGTQLSKLMVIGFLAHLVDPIFSTLNACLTLPFYVVQLTLSPDNR